MKKTLISLIAVITLSSCSVSSYESNVGTLGCYGFVVDGPTATYAYLQDGPDSSGEWIDFSDLDNQVFYRSLEFYESGDSLLLSLEQGSPSGDWFRIDDYCFDSNKKLIRLDSDLRTFYGYVRILRNWSSGDFSIDSPDHFELTDIDTGEKLDPETTSYQDNLPHLVDDYQSLIDYLDFNG